MSASTGEQIHSQKFQFPEKNGRRRRREWSASCCHRNQVTSDLISWFCSQSREPQFSGLWRETWPVHHNAASKTGLMVPSVTWSFKPLRGHSKQTGILFSGWETRTLFAVLQYLSLFFLLLLVTFCISTVLPVLNLGFQWLFASLWSPRFRVYLIYNTWFSTFYFAFVVRTGGKAMY